MILRGKAPLRISFAGGGTDINEVFEKYGGAVINTTINKFTHMTMEKRNDRKIFINDNSLENADEFSQRIVKKLKPKIGFNVWYYNDISPGRGLGSSSTYSILFTRLLGELEGKVYSDHDLVSTVYGIESEVGRCGWQDQYAAAVGGFNFIEFSKTGKTIYPLRIKHRSVCDLEEHLLLVFTKRDHDSGSINSKNIKMINRTKANQLKSLAFKVRDHLLNDDIAPLGKLLHEGWMAKKNSSNTNKTIDAIYDTGLRYGADGGKLLGAGIGGYMLFFVDPSKKKQLKEKFQHEGFETVDFYFTEKGVETWRV